MQLRYKNFSKNNREDKRKKVYLEDINSHRGLGRAALVGVVSGGVLPSTIGGYAGKKHAEDLDYEGASDRQILRGASRRGALVGAGSGATILGLAALSKNGRKLISRNAGRSALGVAGAGIGGYLGAKKNTETRLQKRNRLMREQ